MENYGSLDPVLCNKTRAAIGCHWVGGSMNGTETGGSLKGSCVADPSWNDPGIWAGLWYIGVTISILASIGSNLGTNFMKYSMMLEMRKCDKDEKYVERLYIFQPWWWIGLVLVIFGALGDFIALGFTAQSLATPVGGFTIVANLFFGHFWLKESLGLRDLFATGVLMLGIVGVAVSADKTVKQYKLDCLVCLLQAMRFLVFVAVIVVLIAIIMFLAKRAEKIRCEHGPLSLEYKPWAKWHPVLCSSLSGMLGAQSILAGKMTAELIVTSVSTGANQLVKPVTWVIILCMCGTVFSQLHWLAAGLRHFDAVLVVPIFQCFFISTAVISGGIFFSEFETLEQWEVYTFIGSIMLTLLGVFLLCQRTASAAGESSATVVDESSSGVTIEENAVVPLNQQGGQGSGERDDSSEGAVASSGLSDDPLNNSGTRPPTPMPMSLQYHSLAMSDLYHAIREGLTTPERSSRPGSQESSRRSKANLRGYASSATLSQLPEDNTVSVPVPEDSAVGQLNGKDGAPLQPKVRAKTKPMYMAKTVASKKKKGKGADKGGGEGGGQKNGPNTDGALLVKRKGNAKGPKQGKGAAAGPTIAKKKKGGAKKGSDGAKKSSDGAKKGSDGAKKGGDDAKKGSGGKGGGKKASPEPKQVSKKVWNRPTH